MENDHETSQPNDASTLQQVRHWSRIYAQNRSLPVIANLIVYSVLFVVLAGMSLLGGVALRNGHPIFAWVAFAGFATIYGALIAFICFALTERGRSWVERKYQRLYGNEGSVKLEPTRRRKHPTLGLLIGLLFMIGVIGEVQLGRMDYIPDELAQPISALYVVPFVIFLWWWQRPSISWIALLWPALYTLHALVLLTPLPIPKNNHWMGVHMLIAVGGYGLLVALIAHIYSRYALRKLQQLSNTNAGLQ